MKAIYLCCFAFAALSAPAFPQTAAGGSASLNMFAGSWSSNGTMDGAAQPSHVKGTNVCRWSSDAHVFLVCDGEFTTGGNATPAHQLSVYTYDVPSKQYGFLSMGTDHVGTPDLSLNGNTWSYSGKFKDAKGKTHYYRTLNVFDSPNSYRYMVQSSLDGTRWTQTGSGTSTRTASP